MGFKVKRGRRKDVMVFRLCFSFCFFVFFFSPSFEVVNITRADREVGEEEGTYVGRFGYWAGSWTEG